MEWLVRDYLALIAIVISVVTGIAIPVAKHLFQKYFKKAKIIITPFAKTTFFYNGSGSFIKMRFSLDCRNQDILVNKVYVSIKSKRKTGKEETLYLGWEQFDPVTYSWIGSNYSNSINTTELARPVKVWKNTVVPFIIEFTNNNQDALNDFSALAGERESKPKQQHNLYIKENEGKEFWFSADDASKVIDAFKSTEDFSNLCASYEKYFFWEAGSYTLELSIEYDYKYRLNKTYEIKIDSNDEARMRENTESIVLYSYRRERDLPNSLNILNKEIVEQGENRK